MEFRDPEPIMTEGRTMDEIFGEVEALLAEGHRRDELRLLAGVLLEPIALGEAWVTHLPPGSRLAGVLVI